MAYMVKTTKEFVEKYNKVENSKHVKIIGKYTNCKEKIECNCLICGDDFLATPDSLMQGHIHKSCGISIGRTSSTNIFKEKLKKVNDNIEVLSEYVNAKTKINCKCKICQCEFNKTPNNLLSGQGCPNCSKKETSIKLKNRKAYNKLNKDISYYITAMNNKFEELEFLEIPKTKGQTVKCKCKICGHMWESSIEKLSRYKSNISCKKCNQKVKEEYRHNIFVEKLKNKNPNVELLSKYKNSTTKVYVHCNKCETQYYILPHGALDGCCQGCASIKMRNKFAKTKESFQKDICNKFGENYLLVSDYVNAYTEVKIYHADCKKDFLFIPYNIYNSNVHICPYCYVPSSNGERIIQNYLNENKINYETQKTFNNLRGVNNGLLSYDFYLKELNILIEFQGVQHYVPIDSFGGEIKFYQQQEHDKRKREYAKNHNIKLLEIKYDEINKINDILDNNIRKLINNIA